MGWHDMDGWAWIWMASMMIIFWGAVIAALVIVVRTGRRDGDRRPTSQEVLEDRFARGELSIEEFEQRRAVLQRTDSVEPR